MEVCDGYIASDLDYHLPLKENKKYLGLAPNPIITEDFKLSLPPVKEKVVIFHGINRAAYFKKGSDLFQKAARHTFSRPEHVYLKANFNLLGEGTLGENSLYLGHHCAIDNST